MSLNDPLANNFSVMLNAETVGKAACLLFPVSKLARSIFKILQEHKFLGDLEKVDGTESYKVNLLGKINKCGVVKPRFSVKVEDFEKYEKRYLPARNFGLLIVSTSQGLMTNTEAKEKKVGGKLVAYCY